MSTIVERLNPDTEKNGIFPEIANAIAGRKKLIAMLLVASIGVGLAWQYGWLSSASSNQRLDLLTFRVEPRDLPITVIERGQLESQTNLQVFCEVDDYRSDGINGTTIIWIIENGSSVSKGDLICELDASAIQAELDEQILDTEEAKSAFIQAQANVESQVIENQTSSEKAQLAVELAKLELEMFEDPDTGSHELALAAIEREIDDLNNEILAAEMNLKLARNDNAGIESLFKLGYAGKSELDRSVLSLLKAEGDYAAKLNKLNTQMASLKKLDSFEKQMKKLELAGAVRTSVQGLEQVRLTNEAQLSQKRGILATRTEQLAKEEERLKRYEQQLANCKIFAPQDGMVAYAPPASSRDAEIAEGTAVRLRQHIFSIPNLRTMQVETSIHESALDRVQPGLKVAVTVDAFPDRSYTGTVKSVAVLPERSYYSDTQKYRTIITIDEEVYQLKPGMTAISEVSIDYLPAVNAVPIQSIVQRRGKNWIFVKENDTVQQRKVSLGLSNEQYVIVTEGVEVGDLVVLNPDSLVDDSFESEDSESPPVDDGIEKLVASAEEPAAIN